MDKNLRFQLLCAMARDRAFLKEAGRDIEPERFGVREETIIAEVAKQFWDNFSEPVGMMLRSEVEDAISKQKWGAEGKERLKQLINDILHAKTEMVSVKALIARSHALKRSSFYEEAVDEIIAAHEEGKLSASMLSELVDKANKELDQKQIHAVDYFASLKQRIERRENWADSRYPSLMIDPLDSRIDRLIGPGHLGMFMAPPSGGKGLALIHATIVYAQQGLNVMHISLEDPRDLVEDRLDANLCGIPLRKLREFPRRLRRRFKRMRRLCRGRIRLIDGTDGGWTVARVEKAWEQLKRDGFHAQVIIIDYDDEIECGKSFKGESARRMEFAEIYRELRKLASKTNAIVWTAAQTRKQAEGQRVITMRDTAEDFSKIRKVFCALTIGSGDKEEPNVRHLFVAKHRLDKSRFGVDIVCDYNRAVFFDRERYGPWLAKRKARARERVKDE